MTGSHWRSHRLGFISYLKREGERVVVFFFFFWRTSACRSLILLLFCKIYFCIRRYIILLFDFLILNQNVSLVPYFTLQVDTQISCAMIGWDPDGTGHRGSIGRTVKGKLQGRGSVLGAGVKALGGDIWLQSYIYAHSGHSDLLALIQESELSVLLVQLFIQERWRKFFLVLPLWFEHHFHLLYSLLQSRFFPLKKSESSCPELNLDSSAVSVFWNPVQKSR